NDLACRQGLDAVRQQIQAAQKPEPAPEPVAANDNNQMPEEFGRPLDIFGVAPPPELSIELLPAAMQAYVRDQADLTGCDPAIIGLGAMVAAAACIDDGIKLQPKRKDPTWTEEAR